MSNYLGANGGVTYTVAASDKIATYSRGAYTIYKTVGYPNLPSTQVLVFSGTGANTTSAFTVATEVTIQSQGTAMFYEDGTTPAIIERTNYQAAPGTLNATGTLTATLILGGVVTSTTAAAVVATLDTGPAMDIAINMDVNDSFMWATINTGASNAFTVTASSGHTIVGSGTVALSTSARFMTRKTAADTYVTYRLA